MYPTLLFLSVLSIADEPAIAEKSSDLHRPAVAEFEWGRRQPPEKIFPTFASDLLKDLHDRFPIRTGMNKTEVEKTIEKEARQFPASQESYELSGGRPQKRLPEEPLFVVVSGRGDFMCLVFMKEDRVESIWLQLYIPQSTSFPAFLLTGDPKPRKAVKDFLKTQPPWE